MNRFFTLLSAASCLTAFGQYQVGDVGPAGGWIFYVDAENQFEEWDYLEAWPHTFSFFQLLACDYSPYLSSSELGTGENNTMVFTSNDDTFSAFDFAVLFDGGSRNDWFLPSKSELEALNASSVSALINSGEGYSAASSSVFNECQWWTYDINNGWGIEDDLYSWEWVLPIRSFQTADDGIVCGQGTIWDETSQTCIPDNPSDLNYDGCVDVNDFMGHLAAFGSGCEEGVAETPWQCGDPLEYQGYDYETVQIGEQCWFAENLRYLPEVVPVELGSEDDGLPHSYVYGYEGYSPATAALTSNYSTFGALYNHYAVESWMLCPSGWHVPSDDEFVDLSNSLGGRLVAGGKMKSSGELEEGSGYWIAPNTGASNSSGFNALPAGERFSSVGGDGVEWRSLNEQTRFWTTSVPDNAPDDEGLFRSLWYASEALTQQNGYPKHGGMSIRCLKD